MCCHSREGRSRPGIRLPGHEEGREGPSPAWRRRGLPHHPPAGVLSPPAAATPSHAQPTTRPHSRSTLCECWCSCSSDNRGPVSPPAAAAPKPAPPTARRHSHVPTQTPAPPPLRRLRGSAAGTSPPHRLAGPLCVSRAVVPARRRRRRSWCERAATSAPPTQSARLCRTQLRATRRVRSPPPPTLSAGTRAAAAAAWWPSMRPQHQVVQPWHLVGRPLCRVQPGHLVGRPQRRGGRPLCRSEICIGRQRRDKVDLALPTDDAHSKDGDGHARRGAASGRAARRPRPVCQKHPLLPEVAVAAAAAAVDGACGRRVHRRRSQLYADGVKFKAPRRQHQLAPADAPTDDAIASRRERRFSVHTRRRRGVPHARGMEQGKAAQRQ
eukprot:364807-Chlamydomonas_euryale.AAC.2